MKIRVPVDKKDTVKKWKEKLDRLFAQYIKKRDCINSKGQCFTCYDIFPINQLQAGHFRPRQYNSTRYDEINVQLQCSKCNCFEQGEQWEFGNHLNEKYGEVTALDLIKKSHEIKKFTVQELRDLYGYYKDKIQFLEKELNG